MEKPLCRLGVEVFFVYRDDSMKLEKVFEVKDNKLYKIGGEEVSPAGMEKAVKWSSVEAGAEEYDEAFLADLRDQLKNLEAQKKFVYILPEMDKDAPVDQFIAAMKHTARRIKDCVSVAGFAIPQALSQEDSATYMEELSQKHAQYVYFSNNPVDGTIAKI